MQMLTEPMTAAERAQAKAEREAWDAKDKHIAVLEAKVRAWEDWYEGVVADFVGLTTDASDPQRLHDWEWMDDHRPAPTKL